MGQDYIKGSQTMTEIDELKKDMEDVKLQLTTVLLEIKRLQRFMQCGPASPIPEEDQWKN
jgi:hypothetical protein